MWLGFLVLVWGKEPGPPIMYSQVSAFLFMFCGQGTGTCHTVCCGHVTLPQRVQRKHPVMCVSSHLHCCSIDSLVQRCIHHGHVHGSVLEDSMSVHKNPEIGLRPWGSMGCWLYIEPCGYNCSCSSGAHLLGLYWPLIRLCKTGVDGL